MDRNLPSKTSKDSKVIESTKNFQLLGDDSNKIRLILKIVFVLFIVTLFIPSVSTSKFFILEKSYSVISGAFYLQSHEKIALLILIIFFLVIVPLLNLIVIWYLTSAKYRSNITVFLSAIFHKYRYVGLSILSVLIATIELGLIKKLNSSYGIYIYLFSIIAITLTHSKVMTILGNTDPTKLNEYIDSQTAHYKNVVSNLSKTVIKASIAIFIVFIAIKLIAPEVFDSLNNKWQDTVSSTHTNNKAMTDIEKDVYSTYNDTKTNDPDYDIGKYCLEKEKQGNITFEQCLAISASKLAK